MTTAPSIACSLGAEELPARLAEIRAIGRHSLVAVSPDGSLRFRAGAAVRKRLEDVIAAESVCCSFLAFDLREEAGELVLTVTAPKGAEAIALEIVSAFSGEVR
jgi:hypothetical protein